MRPLVRAVLAAALAVAGAGAVAVALDSRAPTGSAAHAGGGDGRLVLVSGRDDHGLLANPRVTLRERPDGGASVGQVADGTLARVVATRGTWQEVRTAEGPAVDGWVDDFYLRGVVHLVGPTPSCEVAVDGQSLPAGEQAVVLDVRGGQAQVRVARTGLTGWVDRSAVREWAPDNRCDTSPT